MNTAVERKYCTHVKNVRVNFHQVTECHCKMAYIMSTINSKSEGVPRIASKQSVDKAMELLRARAKKSSKRKKENEEEKQNKADSYCAVSLMENHKRKSNVSSGFLHSYAIPEMRNALIDSDWSAMQEMFPLLLKCYHAQPIVWRYAFLIYLCSPVSDKFQFQEFIEMCMGFQANADEQSLEKLMALNNTES